MTPDEALELLVQGAANMIDFPSQATEAYRVQVQEAKAVLAAAIAPKPAAEAAPPAGPG